MSRTLIAPVLIASSLLAQQGGAPRLELEDLAGKVSTLPAAALPLTDPREKGAWIVRPLGFEGLEPEETGEEARARVTLVNGDELSANISGGADETLQLELTGGVVVPFDLAAILSLQFPERIPPEQRLALGPAPEGDRLYRHVGALDVVDGTLEGFVATGVRFDSVLGARTIPWSEVAALYIEALDSDAKPASDARVPVTVDFAGPEGGRVQGRLVALEPAHCRVVLGGKTEVALPFHALAQIVVADGRLAFVSDLEPLAEEGQGAPFGDDLGMRWPHRMDRNVLGGELRSQGSVRRRGIGMHAPSKLSFALDGAPSTLRGRVAIDDSALINGAAARGCVIFRVWGDGEKLWESPAVRGGDAPLELPPLALAGKRALALECDPSGDFAGDRANWLDLVLTR